MQILFNLLIVLFFASFLIFGLFVFFSERKRRVYDQYGKDGLLGDNERNHSARRHDYEDFDFDFVFRSPDEVFREFFGVHSPFAELFGGSGSKYFAFSSLSPKFGRWQSKLMNQFIHRYRSSRTSQWSSSSFASTK